MVTREPMLDLNSCPGTVQTEPPSNGMKLKIVLTSYLLFKQLHKRPDSRLWPKPACFSFQEATLRFQTAVQCFF